MARETYTDLITREFETREICGESVDYKRFPSPAALLHWIKEQGLGEACAQMHTKCGESWSGLDGQSISDILTTGKGNRALQAFSEAQAKLEAQSVIGGRPQAAIAGGAWVIPSVLSGNPMSARIKPRAKLPHKDFRFMLQVSASVNQNEMSQVCAKIARAAWDYVLAGGTVSLTMFYVYGYNNEKRNCPIEAAVFEVNIPLNDSSALALALSTAMYRPILMGLASLVLSPRHNDGIPMKRHITPTSAISLQGQIETDFPILKKAGIL